ncbi:ArsR/SmtB family transcription factor [Halobacterium wangiae]|uniref:ArsR/SmtB family transcription factor n=1 Tax=Halobacterium wangiae TaxID=2902623 RepID=UPI001E33020B|nr:metalloregulator ArsR/SmtB family transcription factor [Halobacterium wangiae]
MTKTESPDPDLCSSLGQIYEDPVARVEVLREDSPPREEATQKERIFKALANTDRVRILDTLRESACCTCELQAALDAPQSTIATHLQNLKRAGLVQSEKDGRWTYYRIEDDAVREVLDAASTIQEGSE